MNLDYATAAELQADSLNNHQRSAFEDGDKANDGIEAGADVTDTANVTAAGALMVRVTDLAGIRSVTISMLRIMLTTLLQVLTAGGFTTTGTWTFDGPWWWNSRYNISTALNCKFGDSNVTLMTAAAIQDKIGTYAGTGLS